ncbi:unnamed protein product [Leptidea sinapis]|uniref:EF-hand domain-containing protein n=1 Tax=Leptidea sinapis TaxID=189913 RepID=A0A5E4PWX3_9NEOP|nr:unnamed protein product [Leptidea sinapis]
MVSDFRKKKLAYVYKKLYDPKNTGFVTENDFDMAMKYVAKVQGWKEGEIDRKAAEQTMLQIWEGLSKAADKDTDGKITENEWVAMWIAQDKNSMAEWQKQYCKVLFHIQDASSDGVLDVQGWKDLEHKAAHGTMSRIWEGLSKAADIDKDGKITSEEWVAMWTTLDKDSMTEWQKQYCNLFFHIQDATCDGVVDRNDFVQVHVNFGIPKDEAVEAYNMLSGDKPSISKEDFEKLFKEFFFSDDINAPGNYLCGTIKY